MDDKTLGKCSCSGFLVKSEATWSAQGGEKEGTVLEVLKEVVKRGFGEYEKDLSREI